MSDQALTPNEFLKLKKSDIEDIFDKNLPQSKGKPYFEPHLYNKITDPTLAEMKKWKLAYVAKAAERKSILNWVLPMIVAGPGLISIIMASGWAKSTSIIFTGCAVAVVAYLWFFGKIWAYESKNYEKNTEEAERALEDALHRRAREWAEERYDMDPAQVKWIHVSNFYIEGKAYRWKELPEGDKYILVEGETGTEVPFLQED